MTGRASHNLIYDGQFLLVIGGKTTDDNEDAMMSEKCTILNEEVECTSQMPVLTDYINYPELFLVPSDYCTELP